MKYAYKFIMALATLLTVMDAHLAQAQEMNVVPLGLMTNARAMYPSLLCNSSGDTTLVFSSNAKWSIAKTYFDQLDRHLYQLYSVDVKNRMPHGSPKPFFGSASFGYNMFSASFTDDGQAYVSHNNLGANVIRGGAPIAVYQYDAASRKGDGERLALPENVNCGMASVSPDGQMLVFASDMRGGEGRVDLYYCTRVGSGWSEPCNMGPLVNTPGNETSPFVHPSGKIFFASDGRDDCQAVDLFYTYRSGDSFVEPIKCDDGMNSSRDDYGIFCSADESWGYVTSNRDGKDQLYYFCRTFPEFSECDTLQTVELCYTLYEASAESYDTTEFSIKWKLGDGTEALGAEVEHCYPGLGTYSVELSVLDKASGEEMFSLAQYELEIERPDQVAIEIPEKIKAGQPVTFRADASGIPDFRPYEFYWHFGNGDKMKGDKGTTIFERPGVYVIKCGTIDARNRLYTRCTLAEITVEP